MMLSTNLLCILACGNIGGILFFKVQKTIDVVAAVGFRSLISALSRVYVHLALAMPFPTLVTWLPQQMS